MLKTNHSKMTVPISGFDGCSMIAAMQQNEKGIMLAAGDRQSPEAIEVIAKQIEVHWDEGRIL